MSTDQYIQHDWPPAVFALMLAAAMDVVLSAEVFEAYKPDPRAYRGVPRVLGVRPDPEHVQAVIDVAEALSRLGHKVEERRFTIDEWRDGVAAEPAPNGGSSSMRKPLAPGRSESTSKAYPLSRVSVVVIGITWFAASRYAVTA